jgi:hypothetical protein
VTAFATAGAEPQRLSSGRQAYALIDKETAAHLEEGRTFKAAVQAAASGPPQPAPLAV